MAPPSVPTIDAADAAGIALRAQSPPPQLAGGSATAPAKAEVAAPAHPSVTRLLIEEIGDTGRFVYKVMDPVTGDIITQLPREEVVKLSDWDNYAAGSVVKTQA